MVKLSREELAFISHLDDLENAIRWMMQTYPLRLLLVTLGGDGVYVHDGQRLRHFRAAPVVPVDTTGAGDAFVAGLLAALARLHELPQEAQWPAVIACAGLRRAGHHRQRGHDRPAPRRRAGGFPPLILCIHGDPQVRRGLLPRFARSITIAESG